MAEREMYDKFSRSKVECSESSKKKTKNLKSEKCLNFKDRATIRCMKVGANVKGKRLLT